MRLAKQVRAGVIGEPLVSSLVLCNLFNDRQRVESVTLVAPRQRACLIGVPVS
jgi:hypothetical protein